MTEGTPDQDRPKPQGDEESPQQHDPAEATKPADEDAMAVDSPNIEPPPPDEPDQPDQEEEPQPQEGSDAGATAAVAPAADLPVDPMAATAGGGGVTDGGDGGEGAGEDGESGEEAVEGEGEDEEELRMTFGEHLEELRKRLIWGLGGLGAVMLFTLYYGRDIVGWLVQPMMRALYKAGLPTEVMASHPASPFTLYIKVALVSAVVIGVPWIVYQVWKFIEPGLYRNEKKIVYALAPFSSIMTLLGVMFMYYMLLPVCLSFMVGFAQGYPQPRGDKPGPMEFLSDLTQAFTGAGNNTEDDESTAEDGATVDQDKQGEGKQGGQDDEAKKGDKQGDGADEPDRKTDPDGQTDEGQTEPGLKKPNPPPAVVLLPTFDDGPPVKPVNGQVWYSKKRKALRFHIDGTTQTYRAAATSILRTMFTLQEYISFTIFLTLGVVIGFQLPVLMTVIGWAKVVDPKRLADARRYAILVILVISAVLTPSDPISMLVLALPMMALFEIGLVLMKRTYGDGPQPWFDDDEEAGEGNATG